MNEYTTTFLYAFTYTTLFIVALNIFLSFKKVNRRLVGLIEFSSYVVLYCLLFAILVLPNKDAIKFASVFDYYSKYSQFPTIVTALDILLFSLYETEK